MTYGAELNAFRANSDEYGAAWHGLVIGKNDGIIKSAMEDAQSFLGGRLFATSRLLQLHNGARLRFAVINEEKDCDRYQGMQFSQITWLYKPALLDRLGPYVRARLLRSNTVPTGRLRHEYVAL